VDLLQKELDQPRATRGMAEQQEAGVCCFREFGRWRPAQGKGVLCRSSRPQDLAGHRQVFHQAVMRQKMLSRWYQTATGKQQERQPASDLGRFVRRCCWDLGAPERNGRSKTAAPPLSRHLVRQWFEHREQAAGLLCRCHLKSLQGYGRLLFLFFFLERALCRLQASCS